MSQTESRGTLIIGFLGYATEGRNYDLQIAATRQILHTLHKRIHLVIHGGTNAGTPDITNSKAKELSMPTLGIVCAKGLKDLTSPLDYLIIEGSKWGDESSILATIAQAYFVFGGGPITLKECQIALAHNKQIVRVNRHLYSPNSAANQLSDPRIINLRLRCNSETYPSKLSANLNLSS
jgi:predicted Rossmann-fold nucleotide-binding protein